MPNIDPAKVTKSMLLRAEPFSLAYSGGEKYNQHEDRHPHLIQHSFAINSLYTRLCCVSYSMLHHLIFTPLLFTCYLSNFIVFQYFMPLCYSLAIYPILLCFNILCPFHLIIPAQCYILREAYVCALCVYLVKNKTKFGACSPYVMTTGMIACTGWWPMPLISHRPCWPRG